VCVSPIYIYIHRELIKLTRILAYTLTYSSQSYGSGSSDIETSMIDIKKTIIRSI